MQDSQLSVNAKMNVFLSPKQLSHFLAELTSTLKSAAVSAYVWSVDLIKIRLDFWVPTGRSGWQSFNSRHQPDSWYILLCAVFNPKSKFLTMKN